MHTHTGDSTDTSGAAADEDLGEEKSNWRARASIARTGETAAGPRVLKGGVVDRGSSGKGSGTVLGGSWLSKAREKAKARKQAKLRAAALARVSWKRAHTEHFE